MHHTTRAALVKLAALERSGDMSDSLYLDPEITEWSAAGYPDADPEPEADLRAELEAARAELDTLAQRLGERDAELRAARAELEAATARANHWQGIAEAHARDADHWRTVAEDLAARPRLRDRVWRWMGGAR